MIVRQTIKVNSLNTISWIGDRIIDWSSSGTTYDLKGNEETRGAYYFAYSFDAAITSACGTYAFIYKRLGTKGVLLKHGQELREINRSYYFAEAYEYPAAFVTLSNRRTYLVHCPIKYCQLNLEDVETGELITSFPGRKPADFFHSRLEVSPDGNYLLSKGWYWHPWSAVQLFDLVACLANPMLLDEGTRVPNCGTEIGTAGFIDQEKVLLGSSGEEPLNEEVDQAVPPCHIAIWDICTNQVSKPVKVQEEFGNLFPINDKYCWDIFKYPKVINLGTGGIVGKVEDIPAGEQDSSIIGYHKESLPLIAYNSQTRRLAILKQNILEILSWE